MPTDETILEPLLGSLYMELRQYQREAIEAVYRYLRQHDDNPCVVIPTHVRTTLRPARDMTVEELALRLDNCRGNIRVLALEFLPETEYEVGTTLMDDYKAIVNEYRSTRQKGVGQ